MSTKSKQKKLDRLYDSIREEVGSSTMDMIQEIVALEIEIEKECNK